MSDAPALPIEVPGLVSSSAVLDDSGRYRYSLTRRWGTGVAVLWVMLNPSTADHETDDATIRRVVGFTRGWGYDAAHVVNLFGYRAHNPRRLLEQADPVGPHNDEWIAAEALEADLFVAAWGAHKIAQPRVPQVVALLDRELHCLGTTGDGSPRHPLYVRGGTEPILWEQP